MARKIKRGRKSESQPLGIKKPGMSRGRGKKKEMDEGVTESIRDLFD